MNAVFDPEAVIAAAIKGASSTRPVEQEKILERGQNKAECAALETALERMTKNCVVMSCTVTRVDKITQNKTTSQTYWPTGMPPKLPYSTGRRVVGPLNTSARVSL